MSAKHVVQVAEHVWQFVGETFYGSAVGTYLIECADSVVLVDLPSAIASNQQFVQSFGKPVKIVLTHGPTGIAAGKVWQRDAKAQIHLEQSDCENVWLSCDPDVVFDATVGVAPELQIIHTPGHTAGSVCVLDTRTRSLFAGDTLGADGDGELLDFRVHDPHNEDVAMRLQSVHGLAQLEFDNLFPFHYEGISGGAGAALRRFIEQMQHS